MSAAHSLGPTKGRNWGWTLSLALAAVVCAAGAVDATLRLGPGWRATGLPLLLGAPFLGGALWVWRQPPFERTALHVGPEGLEIEGRTRRVFFGWSEIAAITYRPSSMGPAHMTIERAARPDGTALQDPITPAGYLAARPHAEDNDAPGAMFPVRAVGVAPEEVVAFLSRGASEAGFRLEEPMRGDGRAVHRFPGPRRWVLIRG